MAFFLQAALEEPGHPGLVLDHQHSHNPEATQPVM
jgi:hypothetical protein